MPTDVNVVVLTRNHAAHIRGCIESILTQNTTYSFNILVFDDGSSDGTDRIVAELRSSNPEKIFLHRSETNLGVARNVKRAIDAVDGRYIALLDGDDKWTFSGKLQEQITLLESEPQYNGSFHDAVIVHLDDADSVLFQNAEKYSHNYIYTQEAKPSDLVKRLIIPSGALVIRTAALKGLPEETVLADRYSVLWKITCHVIRNSKFYYFREVWSEYRNHRQGISKSSNVEFHLSHIAYLRSLLNDEFYSGYSLDIYESLSEQYKSLLYKMHDARANGLSSMFMQYLGVEMKRLWLLYRNLGS